MWLSEVNGREKIRGGADMGRVTMAGEKVGVLSGHEMRNVKVIAPGGYIWRPTVGEGTLVIKCDDGSSSALGVPVPEAPQGMENGEVCIKTASASIWLKNNGEIVIRGDVNIEGSLKVNGNAVE